jgi:hypothetical protein
MRLINIILNQGSCCSSGKHLMLALLNVSYREKLVLLSTFK